MSAIVHITTVHPAFDVRIFHKECRTLAEAGHQVTLVVPHVRDEIVDGVEIRSLAAPGGRFRRMTRTAWQACRIALASRSDVLHLHDPELLPAGMFLKLRGKRVVYDAHEDFPRQVLTHHWIARPLRPVVAAVARGLGAIATRMFDGIVAATPTIATRFPAKKTVVVQNFPIVREFQPGREIPYASRPAQVAYIGVIAPVRGAAEMVEAMSILDSSLGARMVWAGNFSPEELQLHMRNMAGWERIDFVGWMGRAEIAGLLATSRIGIVPLHPTPSYIESWPIKMFEYMAAGIPVIGSDFPLWRQIIDAARCGLLVDPRSPRAIADAIGWLLGHPREAEEMGRRGREAVIRHYNWDAEAGKLLRLYEKIIDRA